VARSLNTTLTEAARAAVQAREWERDREAWNLPHAKDAGTPGPVDRDEPVARDGDAQPEETPPTDPDTN
jgi:hypothetical protein